MIGQENVPYFIVFFVVDIKNYKIRGLNTYLFLPVATKTSKKDPDSA
jgi:hypothetical protein